MISTKKKALFCSQYMQFIILWDGISDLDYIDFAIVLLSLETILHSTFWNYFHSNKETIINFVIIKVRRQSVSTQLFYHSVMFMNSTEVTSLCNKKIINFLLKF